VDFYDQIKSLTKGYGSLDYEFQGYIPQISKDGGDVKRRSIRCISSIMHKDKAASKASGLVGKLKELIPRHLFEVTIQAAVGNQILASEK